MRQETQINKSKRETGWNGEGERKMTMRDAFVFAPGVQMAYHVSRQADDSVRRKSQEAKAASKRGLFVFKADCYEAFVYDMCATAISQAKGVATSCLESLA